MNGGIPKKVISDTKRFEFNNIESLEKLFKKNKYAAVIIEPLASELPSDNFLSKDSNKVLFLTLVSKASVDPPLKLFFNDLSSPVLSPFFIPLLPNLSVPTA